jgi:acyl-CoA reductase-like NAD-dependent aldehyde dehydrogenase
MSACSYSRQDASELVDAVPSFLHYVAQLERASAFQLQSENQHLAQLPWASKIVTTAHGHMLAVIPSNAPVPLGLILPFALAMTGNSVVVAAPRSIGHITKKLVGLLPDQFGVTFWDAGVTDALATLVDNRQVDCLYFTGSSKHLAQLSARCAQVGTSLIFEGEGRGLAVVDEFLPDALYVDTIAKLAEATRFANGQMCSKPSFVLAPVRQLDDIVTSLNSTFKALELSKPTLSFFDTSLHEVLRNRFGIDDNTSTPVAIGGTLDDVETTPELFGPVIMVVPYNSTEELLATTERHPQKLQITYFGENDDLLERVVASSRVARIVVNRQPSLQNPAAPWGGYGLSGNSSPVDLISKGLRRVIVEGTVQWQDH